MSDASQPDIFDELKEDASGWVKARTELLKLELTERFALILASLMSGGFMLIIVFFFLFFIMMALGFYLGELWHSVPLGMLAVAGIVMLKLILFMLLRKPLFETPVVNTIIRKTFEHESTEESQ